MSSIARYSARPAKRAAFGATGLRAALILLSAGLLPALLSACNAPAPDSKNPAQDSPAGTPAPAPAGDTPDPVPQRQQSAGPVELTGDADETPDAAARSAADPVPTGEPVALSGDAAGALLSAEGERRLEEFHNSLQGAPGLDKLPGATMPAEAFDPDTRAARVLVLLRVEGAPAEKDRFSSAESRADWQGKIAGVQDAVINRVQRPGITVHNRYATIPAIACEVTAEGMRALLADPGVVAVQPDYLVERHLAQGIPLMGASTVRGLHDGAGLTIAIVDDGVDYTHPNLGNGAFPNNKVIGGIDTSGFGDADPFPGGGNSHGTSVAGIACGNIPGAITNDYIGGVAPSAKIAAVKVFADGSSSTSSFDVVEGIDWCVANQFLDPANPIMIINLSLGGGKFTSAESAALADPVRLASLNAAVAAGITVIASSGNNGFCDAMGAPAALAPAISVGALYDANIGNPGWCVDPSTCYPGGVSGLCSGSRLAIFESSAALKVTAYSNTANFLDVFGVSNHAFTTATGGGYTSTFGGTSAAAPYVAGVAALLQAAALAETGDYLSPADLRTLLVSTGTPVTDVKGGGLSPGVTKPLVNAEAAYLTLASGNDLPDISVSDSSLSFIMPAGASQDAPLVIRNEADPGGLDLEFAIATSVIDTIGSTFTQVTAQTRYRGNIYEATSNATLTLIEAYLDFAGTVLLDFVVYETDALTSESVKTLIYGEFVEHTGTGPGFYASDPLDLPLEAGTYYIIAVGWGASNVGYFFDENPQPAVSFGQKVQGFGVNNNFPLPTAFTGGLSFVTTNYYQRITTGVPWIAVDSAMGVVAPQADAPVNVTADATGFAPGLYQGNLVITSNDSDASLLNIPVGLRVGLLGDVYVDFGYVGPEFGTMAEPYNTLGEGHEAVAPGPTAQITILGGGQSGETLDLNKEVTITTSGGEATVGGE